MYSLPSNTIGTWGEFVNIFLKKFYPLEKTSKIRNEIVNFRQFGGESFAKYFERFKELLVKCPHHNFEKWTLCQILYDGLENNSRTMLESMCQGNFLAQDHNAAWQFLENLAKKSAQWERSNEKSIYSRSNAHSVGSSTALEAKIDAMLTKFDNVLSSTQANKLKRLSPHVTNVTILTTLLTNAHIR